MKTILKLHFLLPLLSFLLIVSCSKNDVDGDPDPDPVGITSLVLTHNSQDGVLVVDEGVEFIATGNDGVVYSAQAKFYVNDVEITGNSYTFSQEGSFAIKAVYQDVTSNVITFEVISGAERIVFMDLSRAMKNQTITFSLKDADDNDYTAEATFFVNGSSITGNTYSSATEGDFTVYAEYELAGNTETSATEDFNIFIPKRKMVIEDYTGTWCGYCPRMTSAIEAVRDLTDDVAVVAIHNGDPMQFPQEAALRAAFGVTGFPTGKINRTANWAYPHPTNPVVNLAGSETDLTIGVASTLQGTDITVDVKVTSETPITDEKIVVYLVEDGKIYNQVNYYNNDPTSPWYQAGNPIVGFVHNDVLRMSFSNILGDPISARDAFQEFTTTYTATISPNYVPESLRVVVMVVGANNVARNAQFAMVNEAKDYE